MEYPKLYRKRLIPKECILLENDTILEYTEDHLVTAWDVIRPKKNLHHGISCYFFNEGIKVSKFFDTEGHFLCWYCDIIEHQYFSSDNSLVVTDLLADVIIYPDGSVKVVDLDELAIALEEELITITELKNCLRQVNQLLSDIYSGNFHSYTERIERYSV